LSANAFFQRSPDDSCMILIYMNEKKECQGDIPFLNIFSEEKNDAAGEEITLIYPRSPFKPFDAVYSVPTPDRW